MKKSCNNCEYGNNYNQPNCIGCNPPEEFNHFKQKNDIEVMKDKIEADLPHHAEEVICVKCLHRNIAIYPVGTQLKTLECDCCHNQGYIILTGEDMNSSPSLTIP